MKRLLIISEDEKFRKNFIKKNNYKIFVGGKTTKIGNKLNYISNIDAHTNNLPKIMYNLNEVFFSDEFISYLNEHELFAFDFITNIAVNGQNLNYKDLRFYFHAIVYKWLSILKKKKISIILTDNVPNKIYSYCIYIISKFLKIKFIIIKRAPKVLGKNRIYLIDNYKYDKTSFNSNYIFKKSKNLKFPDIRVTSDCYLKDNLNFKASKNEEKILLDFKKLDDLRGIAGRPNIIKKFLYLRKMKKQKKDSISYYNKAVSKFQKKKKYVFFSNKINSKNQILNYNFHFDLKFSLEFILNIMPKDWIIYFQEDSPNSRVCNYYGENFKIKKYYEEIALLSSRIKFLDTEIPIIDIISNAQVVGTINGDEAWISLVNKIPSFNFIQSWYNQCKLVSFIKDSEDMFNFFQNYKKIKDILSKKKIDNFNEEFLSKSIGIEYIDKFYKTILKE